MRCLVLLLAASFAAAPLSAQKVLKNTAEEIVLRWDFNEGSGGWLAGFTDYTLEVSDLRRMAEIRRLPAEVDSSRFGYFLQSMNRSDDIFMYLKTPLTHEMGLEANTRYGVTIDIEFLSNEPEGCFGVGGPPAEAVTLKAGVTPVEPIPLLIADYVDINVDKGQQVTGGRDAGVVSHIGNGRACEDEGRPYVFLHRVYHHPEPVTSRPDGKLWVMVGTDSGYEGLTQLYYYSIQVTLRPLGQAERD
jgi:hypothetical protein